MCFFVCLILRSSEILEPITITSSVTASDENVEDKEIEKEEESETPSEEIASINVRPPHTSPHPSFGTEVRLSGRKAGNFTVLQTRTGEENTKEGSCVKKQEKFVNEIQYAI